MKQLENYKPRIREKCKYCKVYLPKNTLNDICLKCSKAVCNWLKDVYVTDRNTCFLNKT